MITMDSNRVIHISANIPDREGERVYAARLVMATSYGTGEPCPGYSVITPESYYAINKEARLWDC